MASTPLLQHIHSYGQENEWSENDIKLCTELFGRMTVADLSSKGVPSLEEIKNVLRAAKHPLKEAPMIQACLASFPGSSDDDDDDDEKMSPQKRTAAAIFLGEKHKPEVHFYRNICRAVVASSLAYAEDPLDAANASSSSGGVHHDLRQCSPVFVPNLSMEESLPGEETLPVGVLFDTASLDEVKKISEEKKDNRVVDSSERPLVLAFRGSVDILDGKTDVSVHASSTYRGKVHAGFWSRAAAFPINFFKGQVENYGRHIVVCGHSLGGATATLFTVRLLEELPSYLHDHIECLTFGCPLVGDRDFSDYIQPWKLQISHFIDTGDLVPYLLRLLSDENSKSLADFAKNVLQTALTKGVSTLTAIAVSGVQGKVSSAISSAFSFLSVAADENKESIWKLMDATIARFKPDYIPSGRYFIFGEKDSDEKGFDQPAENFDEHKMSEMFNRQRKLRKDTASMIDLHAMENYRRRVKEGNYHELAKFVRITDHTTTDNRGDVVGERNQDIEFKGPVEHLEAIGLKSVANIRDYELQFETEEGCLFVGDKQVKLLLVCHQFGSLVRGVRLDIIQAKQISPLRVDFVFTEGSPAIENALVLLKSQSLPVLDVDENGCIEVTFQVATIFRRFSDCKSSYNTKLKVKSQSNLTLHRPQITDLNPDDLFLRMMLFAATVSNEGEREKLLGPLETIKFKSKGLRELDFADDTRAIAKAIVHFERNISELDNREEAAWNERVNELLDEINMKLTLWKTDIRQFTMEGTTWCFQCSHTKKILKLGLGLAALVGLLTGAIVLAGPVAASFGAAGVAAEVSAFAATTAGGTVIGASPVCVTAAYFIKNEWRQPILSLKERLSLVMAYGGISPGVASVQNALAEGLQGKITTIDTAVAARRGNKPWLNEIDYTDQEIDSLFHASPNRLASASRAEVVIFARILVALFHMRNKLSQHSTIGVAGLKKTGKSALVKLLTTDAVRYGDKVTQSTFIAKRFPVKHCLNAFLLDFPASTELLHSGLVHDASLEFCHAMIVTCDFHGASTQPMKDLIESKVKQDKVLIAITRMDSFFVNRAGNPDLVGKDLRTEMKKETVEKVANVTEYVSAILGSSVELRVWCCAFQPGDLVMRGLGWTNNDLRGIGIKDVSHMHLWFLEQNIGEYQKCVGLVRAYLRESGCPAFSVATSELVSFLNSTVKTPQAPEPLELTCMVTIHNTDVINSRLQEACDVLTNLKFEASSLISGSRAAFENQSAYFSAVDAMSFALYGDCHCSNELRNVVLAYFRQNRQSITTDIPECKNSIDSKYQGDFTEYEKAARDPKSASDELFIAVLTDILGLEVIILDVTKQGKPVWQAIKCHSASLGKLAEVGYQLGINKLSPLSYGLVRVARNKYYPLRC